ncbi:MAG: PHP domain-containing protein [bacterium]
MLIDLHTHTHCSDGTLSPCDLIDYAKKSAIGVLAVTDHDELGANIPAQRHGREVGVEVIPGVELSIDEPQENGQVHILGLFIDPENRVLQESLFHLKQARVSRAKKIIHLLNEQGMTLHYTELAEIIGTGSAGRPHIAALLMKKRIVSSMDEAFKKYLSKGKCAYVPKKKLKLQPAIDLIHEAGGLAILAHPNSLDFYSYSQLQKDIVKMREQGLDGIEVFYPSHDKYFTQWLLNLARQHQLAVSGGSDFHGACKPEIQIGIGWGNLCIPVEIVTELKKKLAAALSEK